MLELLPDKALAGAAFEEELAGFGVFGEEVGLVVDELKWATVACGAGLAGCVFKPASSEVSRVAGVEVAVPASSSFEASACLATVSLTCVARPRERTVPRTR